ncbi:Asp-tRNA(Asn)/Glu-tRNA(Gln) amidotransferase subunit GatC [Craterilacuibacter sp.]|uniref:Asp-tRNA(Asn)/Glu-tRNA(Gln) amidotransferase subunit GatC n=1 Tax=Craterilacuibacter sp. TaxID=2870909 RepID=UPI003F2B2404
MPLTHQDVARIAQLSRIAVTDAEIEAVGAQLNNIFGLIEKMQAVNTDGIEPMAHPQDVSLRLREDVVTETNHREAYQAVAPMVEKGLFLVPKVIE